MPGSKSHTIRALAIATLAEGRSRIRAPLASADTESCVAACRALGAEVEQGPEEWIVRGTAGSPRAPEDVVNVGNSGTTLYILMSVAALCDGWTVFTGDSQIRARPVEPLLDSLVELGARGFTTRGNGRPPLALGGRLRGGEARIACPTSQYLTSLLLSCPLAEGDSRITVTELNERPYVQMTLDWLKWMGIRVSCTQEPRHGGRREAAALAVYQVEGGQSYRAFDRAIPGDYSSATFFLCAAAVTGGRLTLEGLDRDDIQGDREVLSILERMGCGVRWSRDAVTLTGGPLRGGAFDLNGIPDALPALAVTACFAEGTTELTGVPQARLKETDRIAVMREELSKMGARIQEKPDGLIVEGAGLRGARVSGHADHRVVMALAVAGKAASGETSIDTAEAARITFPGFFDLLAQAGAEPGKGS